MDQNFFSIHTSSDSYKYIELNQVSLGHPTRCQGISHRHVSTFVFLLLISKGILFLYHLNFVLHNFVLCAITLGHSVSFQHLTENIHWNVSTYRVIFPKSTKSTSFYIIVKQIKQNTLLMTNLNLKRKKK